jgi:radical SAM superfamily enzyme YgiQ (UPF0313 family)
MKASGAFLLSYGLESYSQTILNSMKKNITPKQIKQTAELMRKYCLGFQGNFIFGDVSETCETAKETLDFVRKNRELLGASIGLFFVIPFQGTPIYKRCVAERKIVDELRFIEYREKNWFKYLEPMNMTELTDKEFTKLKNEVFKLHLVSDTYNIPVQVGNNLVIKCPSCNGTFAIKGVLPPTGFSMQVVGCRNCHYRFHIVSKWYWIRRISIRTLGFKTVYRIREIVAGCR